MSRQPPPFFVQSVPGDGRADGLQKHDEATRIDPTTGLAEDSTIAPLNVPPSRARRQFAARLAARRAEAEAASHDLGSDDDGEEDEDDELVRLHREDLGEEIGVTGGMRAHHVRGSSGDIKSDDSLPDSEGEDVGIVMRKSTRSSQSSVSTGSQPKERLRLGKEQRRTLFSLDRDDSLDSDEGFGDRGDGDDDIELEGGLGQGEKQRIVEAFERLGIDVRTPDEEGFHGELGFDGEEGEAGEGAHSEGKEKVGEELAKEREVGI
ncbi:NADPH-dependent diflavin oxidoreductase 1 [Venturia nashicola]|uniref:NADPH-dependent diflavin oxidoreductase 1 n=1 Tax=Venturia nashicola TaxID=86259 RepID=A0A4Z1NKR6_9PEZI|nr:NADPH-dependent diflavin oxidoreductase 1 [Venturia nashicola]